MSPAKMFASMKQRENKTQRQEVPNSSRRELFNGGESTSLLKNRHFGLLNNNKPSIHSFILCVCVCVGSLHESRDTPVPTAHSLAETEDTTLKTPPGTMGVVNRGTEDSADGPSDADDSEDTLIPAAPSQPILLEDPLVLKSPQIKFKRNHWPQQKNFPVVSRGRKATRSCLVAFVYFLSLLNSYNK